MGGLFGGGGGVISSSDTLIGGIRVQTSAYGRPVPLLWGKNRITANLIWYSDFLAVPHTTTTSSGGGKGGGEVSQSNTTYSYQAAVAMNLCEGPVSAVGNIWAGKDISDLATLGLTLFGGELGQAAWGYLTTTHADEALAYSGSAYVAGAAYQLTPSADLPNHSFEVTGPLSFSDSVADALPGAILTDFLGNAHYGACPGSDLLGDLTAYNNYCRAYGLFLSPALTEQRPAQECITGWLRLTNSQSVWSEGQLKIIPYGDRAMTANGVTFTPSVTPVYDLTDDDFLPTGGDPVMVSRTTVADAFNSVQIEFVNRENQYNVEIAEAKDQSAIELFGLRVAEPLTAHDIADASVARFVAQKEVQRYQQVRNTYEFRLGWKYCLLEPMDLVTISDLGLGLYQFPVRITEIEEDEDGQLSVKAENFPDGSATVTHTVTTPPGTGTGPNTNIAPGSVNEPVIFRPPNIMTAPDLEVWIAASGGAHWGGSDVYVSSDGSSYRKIGTISNPARHGVLSANLATGGDPDTAHALSVDLSACRGQMVSGTQTDADNLVTLMWVDGELIAYETATLTAQYHYDLTYLRRGAKGTVIAAHSSGAKFARLDNAIFRYVVPAEMVGQQIWVKLPSFNVFGKAPQSLADVAPYSYTLTGNKPAALATLTATGGMFLNRLSWTFVSGVVGIAFTEIWAATSNNRASAVQLTTAIYPTKAWTHPGLQPGQTWYYWGRVIDTGGNASDWYPVGSTSGVPAAPSADPSDLLIQLQNSLGLQQLANDLAHPISIIGDLAPQVQAACETALQLLLQADQLKRGAQFEHWVTSATTVADPATGMVQLLATASVTTDVEAHLNSVDITLNAVQGSITSHTASLSSVAGNISTLETEITQLQGQIALSTNASYIESAVAASLATLNPDSTTAIGLLQALLDVNATRTAAQLQGAHLAATQLQMSSVADAVHAEANERVVLAAQMSSNLAAIVQTQHVAATATDAIASSVTTLAAVVSGNTAAITSEQTARANADSANASNITTVQARLDSGDYAAVKTESSANASALSGLSAKWSVKVDVNGHVAGIELNNGTGGSSFVMLADKFLWVMPDGSGTPVQMLVGGLVNGVGMLGFNGNLIIDGTILARHLTADTINATNGQSVISDLSVGRLKITGMVHGTVYVPGQGSGTVTHNSGRYVVVVPYSSEFGVAISAMDENSFTLISTASGGGYANYIYF